MTRILRSAIAVLGLLAFLPWVSSASAFPDAAPEDDFIRGVWLHPGQFARTSHYGVLEVSHHAPRKDSEQDFMCRIHGTSVMSDC